MRPHLHFVFSKQETDVISDCSQFSLLVTVEWNCWESHSLTLPLLLIFSRWTPSYRQKCWREYAFSLSFSIYLFFSRFSICLLHPISLSASRTSVDDSETLCSIINWTGEIGKQTASTDSSIGEPKRKLHIRETSPEFPISDFTQRAPSWLNVV